MIRHWVDHQIAHATCKYGLTQARPNYQHAVYKTIVHHMQHTGFCLALYAQINNTLQLLTVTIILCIRQHLH